MQIIVASTFLVDRVKMEDTFLAFTITKNNHFLLLLTFIDKYLN